MCVVYFFHELGNLQFIAALIWEMIFDVFLLIGMRHHLSNKRRAGIELRTDIVLGHAEATELRSPFFHK